MYYIYLVSRHYSGQSSLETVECDTKAQAEQRMIDKYTIHHNYNDDCGTVECEHDWELLASGEKEYLVNLCAKRVRKELEQDYSEVNGSNY